MTTIIGKAMDFARGKKPATIDLGEKSATIEKPTEGLSALYDDSGLTIEQCREMLEREPQLKAAVYLKIYARIATGWTIEPASNDPRDVEIAEFVRDQIQQMAGTMDGVLRRAMLAMAYKLSVHEIVYRYIDSGRWAGKYGWQAIKTKNAETFTVKTDEFGNIQYLEQKIGRSDAVKLDPSYFMLWAWEHDGDFKGKSDLRAAYRWYRAKDMIARFWNIFLERYAMPLPLAKHPANAQKAAVDALVKTLATLTTNKAAAVPKEWEVEFVEATRQGGDYQGAIDYCDRMMARSVLVPQLLLDEGKSGSYSLGKSHGESFRWVLSSLGQETEEDIVGDQMIRRLVDLNYAVENYPQFRFKPFTDDSFGPVAAAFCSLVDKGIVDNTEPVIRERLSLPQRGAGGADSDTVGDVPDARARAAGESLPNLGKVTPPRPSGPGSSAAGHPGASGSSSTAAPIGVWTTKDRNIGSFAEAPAASRLKHAAKMDFAEASKRLDEIEAETQRNAARAIQAMHLDFKRELRKQRIVESRDFKAVDKLRIGHVGELRAALESGLGLALAHGAEDGYTAVLSGLEAAGVESRPQAIDRTALNFNDAELSYSMRDILNAWQGKVPVQKELLGHYTRQSFMIAGNVSQSLLEQSKAAIGRGLARGHSYSAIESALNDIFEPYYLTEIDPAVGTSARLHNIVRTNMSEAYNTGQMNLFKDPEVGDFIRAFEYSSVMDNRTSDYCEVWHGVVLKKDDGRWVAALPPNHFQCRATLIPIVQGEAFTETTNPPSLLPQIGFRM